jgi:hypothetical protein
MDAQSYAKILSGINIANPDRIVCKIYDKKYLLIESAEQTNDTLGWYAINSKAIEKCLQANNLLWCYVIETAPKSQPFIYMFIGEDISREYLENEMKEAAESIPEGRNVYFEEGCFDSIDIDQYDDSKTVLEQEVFRIASEVFRVYEP